MKPQIQTSLALATGMACLLYFPTLHFLGRVSPRLSVALFGDSVFYMGFLALVCLCMGLDRVYNYFFHGRTPCDLKHAPGKADLILSVTGLVCGFGGVLILFVSR